MRTLSVILAFTRQDLIDRYSGSIIGGGWSLLMPLVNILIFTLVFSKVMGAKLSMVGMETSDYNYSVYLVSGLLAWNCFAATVTRTTTFYHDKAGIISKVSISLRTLPLYLLLSESVIYLLSTLFFLIFMQLINYPLSSQLLLLVPVFLLQQILGYSLGLICATLAVFIRDIRELVGIVFNLWFWLTPIVYVANILPDNWGHLMAYNPASHFINAYREIILWQRAPSLEFFIYAFLVAALMLKLALFLNRRMQRDIRDFI